MAIRMSGMGGWCPKTKNLFVKTFEPASNILRLKMLAKSAGKKTGFISAWDVCGDNLSAFANFTASSLQQLSFSCLV